MDKSYNSFIWYVGVVEDRNDPKQLGRCRVRCLGYHTSSKESLPTNDLPWAYPMMPITSASMNGIGGSPVGPVEGTWVFGFLYFESDDEIDDNADDVGHVDDVEEEEEKDGSR